MPIVTHAGVLPDETIVLQNSIATGTRGSGLKADGRAILDPLVVRAVASRLAVYVPLGPMRGYWRITSGGRLVPSPTTAPAARSDRR